MTAVGNAQPPCLAMSPSERRSITIYSKGSPASGKGACNGASRSLEDEGVVVVDDKRSISSEGESIIQLRTDCLAIRISCCLSSPSLTRLVDNRLRLPARSGPESEALFGT